MQLSLLIHDEIESTTHIWTTLDEVQRVAVIEALAKLIAQAAQNEEAPDDERD